MECKRSPTVTTVKVIDRIVKPLPIRFVNAVFEAVQLILSQRRWVVGDDSGRENKLRWPRNLRDDVLPWGADRLVFVHEANALEVLAGVWRSLGLANLRNGFSILNLKETGGRGLELPVHILEVQARRTEHNRLLKMRKHRRNIGVDGEDGKGLGPALAR
jgi:hypothetical protein